MGRCVPDETDVAKIAWVVITSMHKGAIDGRGLRVCMLVRNDMVNDPRVTRHAEALGAHGFNVAIACTASARTAAKEKHANYEILRAGNRITLGLESLALRMKSRSPLRILVRLIQLVILQFALFRTAKETEAHIYCANDLDTLLIGVLATVHSGRLVYDSHELWTDMLFTVPAFVRQMLRAYEKCLIRRADIVMTVNELIGEVLASRYSIRAPIEIVYNCPSARTTIRNRKRPRKRRLKTALYQGRYVAHRGLENLVRAAQYLLPDVELVFRGFGPIEKDLRALASARNNVRFVQPVPMKQLVQTARIADVGIVSYIPSNLNNFLASPNKLFEYMHAGLPVAASDIPFMRKVVYENDIGVIFDPHDPRSIAEAINQITRTRELSRHRRMIKRAVFKYNWQNEEKKLLHVYAWLEESLKQDSKNQTA